MHLNLIEYTARLFKRLLWVALIVDAVFLIFLPMLLGGMQSRLSSNIRLVSFAVIFLAGLFKVLLIRKTIRKHNLLTEIAARMNTIISIRVFIGLLGLAIIAGVTFLLLPAFEAYQVLVSIPRLYPLIAPFVGWLLVQAALLFVIILVISTHDHNSIDLKNRALSKSLLVSCGVLIGTLYVSSIFIAWFAKRGFRLF